MAWTPTEGMKRANLLMVDIEGDLALGQLAPMARAMMFNRIADAIDEALGVGAAQHALMDKIVGNGHFPMAAYGVAPNGDIRSLTNEEYKAAVGPAATADPIGFDPVVEAHEEGPGSTSVFSIDPLNLGDVQLVPMGVSDAPKKKRGRPKGSKAKKAKPAKTKAAKPEVVVDNTGGADYAVATADPASEPTIDLVQ